MKREINIVFQIAKRDFKSFFSLPIVWLAAFVIFSISSIVFYILIQQLLTNPSSDDPIGFVFSTLFHIMEYFNIFIIPVFTMKVASEEIMKGTDSLLRTSPIHSFSIILGKFLGIVGYFCFLTLLLQIYTVYLMIFGHVDLKIALAGAFGYLLNVSLLTALSLFVNYLMKNPMSSYLGSVFLVFGVMFSGLIQGVPEWFKEVTNILTLGEDFYSGLIKTSSLALYAGYIIIFLYICRLMFEMRKWKL
jgi:ABC-2 type transport system permease protein